MKVLYYILFLILFTAHNNRLLANDSITVYIFLLDDCIICQSYTPILNDLYKEYKDEFEFLGLFPNFSSRPKKIDNFRDKYDIKYPLKTDYFKTYSNKYKVETLPEVVVFNHSLNQISYKGRIDNEFVAFGRRRKVVTEHDLKDFLYEIKKNNKARRKFTESIGCLIENTTPLKMKGND